MNELWKDLVEQSAVTTTEGYDMPSRTDEARAIISIAISLKRIADELAKRKK